MGPQHLRLVQLFCLLGAISTLPRAGALLCYEATASRFRAVAFHNWKWLLMRNMVCKLQEGCEETLVFIETGTARGVVGFKGCSSSSSYPAQISYLVSPPGVSIASYSRVCRSYLCNNLTNLEPFVKLKASTPKSITSASCSCPTCVGEHMKDCLPNFVTTNSCPLAASTCYSSTLKFQAGFLNTTFLLMGCAREHNQLLADFHHIGSIKVTEVLNILEKSQIVGAASSRQDPAWGVVLGLLFAFRD
ncbi:LY6/PLAUR domain containing 4 [Homo sapiens]|uniref:Ly6/PLAUR domain-containing protein 4 n=2 Tax=Homo sapiens TaxID=9606 RepID=LYPD4_HUMAN|nr:ly6/PLAUR domain-containing protein 4 isoform 1 precursor [Homo sapiens]XP_024307141.1 ly6/PLAUR domain-containing protein 4 isoform X4 [Homo sapiens]XP_054175845.1 ly6/PLAUR domain-containing protein 4 isoform X4 [Homo sapiens]Q6UWN0.2 RecName: Full=Ly6/PLAUR domain-containing protein 4; Flags: Precursor [Homo sapiens]AAX08121.1 sperm membrane receptor [Homo sapiens]AEE61070.1 testicular tissue protein Li 159 [Homo sapiens]EAW57067.1 LY6/PLAUR domain containing 4, isoform CRA_b [Homo sapi|eukprot:NP_775777.3 ly6/PLAUR domain-containing protein 4 precursor [Homo sapiens]